MTTTANTWHPICLSDAIEAGASAGTHLHGDELVVWRDTAGAPHVWEDRCPHRGMKLSFGFVRGDHIACLYHGWQYDAAGQCRYIPAHPDLDVPKTIKVPVHRVAERAGMIWTAEGGEGDVPPEMPETALPVISIYLDCDIAAAATTLSVVPLSPFRAVEAAEFSVTVAHALATVTVGADTLLVGIQPVSPQKTALHIAITGSPETYLGAGQAHVHDWALALRRHVESGKVRLAQREEIA